MTGPDPGRGETLEASENMAGNAGRTGKAGRASAGFTLMELLLVMVILATLAALVLPNLAGRSEESRITSAKAQIELFRTALSQYEIDNGTFPSTDQGLEALLQEPQGDPKPRDWKGPYLEKTAIPVDPWGSPYVYQSPGVHMPRSYDLYTRGPDGRDNTDDDIVSWK